MAAGVTSLSDLIVPSIFTPYVQNRSKELSALYASGAAVSSDFLNTFLAGPGLTINVPNFKDLDNDAENIADDNPATLSSPNKIGSLTEIAVRMNRNNSWSNMALNNLLTGADPMAAIGDRVANYWAKREQAAFIAMMTGIFAMNAAAPVNGSTHAQNDMVKDIKGASYVDGTTTINNKAMIDAFLTMGDAMEDLALICMHSIPYSVLQKANLIVFVPDLAGMPTIPTFLGRRVIVDDGMPASAGVYETWLFGAGAVLIGDVPPPDATEVSRVAAAGNGSGQDILHNRIQRCMHVPGHAYIGTAPAGGPSNLATANNLAAAGSWKRVYPERKQIPIARLITREA